MRFADLLIVALAACSTVACSTPKAAKDADGKEAMHPPPRADETNKANMDPKNDQSPPAQASDARIRWALSQPFADDTLIEFFYMNRGKNPRVNYRWRLRDTGDLFLVRHSGQNPQFDVPFDQPLPTTPTKTLNREAMEELKAMLAREKFFDQPDHQINERAEDGDIVIVRARAEARARTVIWESEPSPIVDALYNVAQ